MMTSIDDVLDYLITGAIPIISILVGLAIVVFFWGIVKFVAHAGDEKAHEEAKQLMIWGLLAFVVMVSFWGIIGFLQESLNDASGGGASSLSTLELQHQNIPAG